MATQKSRLETGSEIFRTEPPPKLATFIDQHGFKDGIVQFDEALAQWHDNLSKKLADSFELKKS